MFGQNPIRKPEDNADGKYQVAEIFYTIQGEGPFAGQPSVFLRLSGCNLRCWFCDTKWDDEKDRYMTAEETLGEVLASAPEGMMGPHKRPLVVLTGGEPLRQNVDGLVSCLLHAGFDVQIETAGTVWRDCILWDGVTTVVSPKTASISRDLMLVATNQRHHTKPRVYFKYVVQAGMLMDDGLPYTTTQAKGRPAVLARPPEGFKHLVYLSPCDEYEDQANKANMKAVARSAMAHGYNAGIQLHKILGLD